MVPEAEQFRSIDLSAVTAGTLAVALFGSPLLAWLADRGTVALDPVGEVAVRWLLVALVLGVAVGVEGRSLAGVGFRRPDRRDAAYLVGTAAAALAVFAATDPLVGALGLRVAGDGGAGGVGAEAGPGLALVGAVTVGVVEEVLFRAYPIESLLDATDSALVAGAAAWGGFTLAHAPAWPLGNLLQIGAVAAVFTLVYLRRRTLVPVVGAHLAVWVLAVLGRGYG